MYSLKAHDGGDHKSTRVLEVANIFYGNNENLAKCYHKNQTSLNLK